MRASESFKLDAGSGVGNPPRKSGNLLRLSISQRPVLAPQAFFFRTLVEFRSGGKLTPAVERSVGVSRAVTGPA